jgi:hypothetical protein
MLNTYHRDAEPQRIHRERQKTGNPCPVSAVSPIFSASSLRLRASVVGVQVNYDCPEAGKKLGTGAPDTLLLADRDIEEGLPVVFRRRCVETVDRVLAQYAGSLVKRPAPLDSLRRRDERQ